MSSIERLVGAYLGGVESGARFEEGSLPITSILGNDPRLSRAKPIRRRFAFEVPSASSFQFGQRGRPFECWLQSLITSTTLRSSTLTSTSASTVNTYAWFLICGILPPTMSGRG